jgi:hypothetical protein
LHLVEEVLQIANGIPLLDLVLQRADERAGVQGLSARMLKVVLKLLQRLDAPLVFQLHRRESGQR